MDTGKKIHNPKYYLNWSFKETNALSNEQHPEETITYYTVQSVVKTNPHIQKWRFPI